MPGSWTADVSLGRFDLHDARALRYQDRLPVSADVSSSSLTLLSAYVRVSELLSICSTLRRVLVLGCSCTTGLETSTQVELSVHADLRRGCAFTLQALQPCVIVNHTRDHCRHFARIGF